MKVKPRKLIGFCQNIFLLFRAAVTRVFLGLLYVGYNRIADFNKILGRFLCFRALEKLCDKGYGLINHVLVLAGTPTFCWLRLTLLLYLLNIAKCDKIASGGVIISVEPEPIIKLIGLLSMSWIARIANHKTLYRQTQKRTAFLNRMTVALPSIIQISFLFLIRYYVKTIPVVAYIKQVILRFSIKIQAT